MHWDSPQATHIEMWTFFILNVKGSSGCGLQWNEDKLENKSIWKVFFGENNKIYWLHFQNRSRPSIGLRYSHPTLRWISTNTACKFRRSNCRAVTSFRHMKSSKKLKKISEKLLDLNSSLVSHCQPRCLVQNSYRWY